MWYIYILQSKKDDGLYIGYTNNLKKRVKEHNKSILSEGPVVQLARTSVLHTEGRGFESRRVHKNKERSDYIFIGCRNASAFWRHNK